MSLTPGAPSTGTPPPGTPIAKVKRKPRISPVWLIPIIAAIIVLYLGYLAMANRGTVITITFKTAEGLSAQQTLIKHKAVALGTVEDVRLSGDLSRVLVRVRVDSQASAILTDHARFWVVRPRLTTGNLSGLETLVSGAYIEFDPGLPGGHEQHTYTGLEEPPGVRTDEPGHTYVLKAKRLGSLGAGAPVFYRDVSVGEVLSYDLGDGKGPVSIRIFVRAPYDNFVRQGSHFWNASGISLAMGPEGIHVEVESIQSVLSGGIAFESPLDQDAAPVSENDASFRLFDSKVEADGTLYSKNVACVTYFQSSVQGLARNSPVVIFGVQVGTVNDVRLVLDPRLGKLVARVTFDIQPERVFKPEEYKGGEQPQAIVRSLVEKGMRVTLDSSNLLTGQKMLSLQYVPKAKPGDVEQEGELLVLPSQGGGLDNVTASLSEVASKLNQIPFDEIGKNVNKTLLAVSQTVGGQDMQNALHSLSETLRDADKFVREADAGLQPALQRLPEIADQLQKAVQRANTALGETGYGQNSDFQRALERVMNQVSDTARTFRLLADFLDRHPEALIRGRSSGGSEK